MQRIVNRWAFCALLLGAVGISFAPIFVRLSEVGSTATAFYRLGFALPLLWLWMSLEARKPDPPRKPASASDYWMLVFAGLWFTGDLAFWHLAIHWTSVANATLLANFAPLFVTLGAWLFLSERIGPRFITALVMAFLGATLLLGASLSLNPQHLAGDAIGLVTAVFYAGYQLSVKYLRRSFSTAVIMAWSGLVSCGALLIIALLSGEKMMAVSAAGWLVLIALAWISHVGGQSLIAYAFGHLPASFSSLTLLLQPVIAAGLAWILLKEALSPLQALGGVIVLWSILIASRPGLRN
jgi:drug/metabolite transporter (DMT)-like permease